MGDFEVSIGDYGRMIFEMMIGEKATWHIEHQKKYGGPEDHWDSIRAKAEPLVRELLKLNAEMNNGGYKIHGYTDLGGKKALSNWERIELAQDKLWGTTADTLKVGDQVWLAQDSDYEMYITETCPCPVEFINDKYVGIEIPGFNCEYIAKFRKTTKVYKAPEDFDDREDLYMSQEYWLEQATKLGL